LFNNKENLVARSQTKSYVKIFLQEILLLNKLKPMKVRFKN